MVGTTLEQWLPEQRTRLQLLERPDQPVEGELLHSDGSRMPVELILRSIDFGGKPHRAIAVRDLRARKQAEQHIRFLAHHDVLTGLPNRNFFNKKLDQEIETCLVDRAECSPCCVSILIGSRRSTICLAMRPAIGCCRSLAGRITALLDDSQTMARLSGDEFAIVIPGLSDPSVAGRIAENILDDLQAANTKAETDALVSTSIGIAICPDDATDRNALLTHADTALYRAKNDGRGVYRFFEAAMGAAALDRRMLEHDLRRAISRDELEPRLSAAEGYSQRRGDRV